jgi:hypothetical protein
MSSFKPRRTSAKVIPMHSHDRTLLSSLGFADVDKGNTRHDLACEYLCDYRRVHKLFGFDAATDGSNTGATLERHISKGTGQYKSTIGFLDISGTTWLFKRDARAFFVIEVKIAPVSVGDMIRQIKLYREYWPPPRGSRDPFADDDVPDIRDDVRWAIVADFDLDDGPVQLMKTAGIVFARLGPAFEAWLKKRPTKRGPRKLL